MKPRHGRTGVAEFFAYVATMQIQDFQVLDILASHRQVVVEVQISITMAGGGSVTDEELHLYSLNDEGKINRMRQLSLCRPELLFAYVCLAEQHVNGGAVRLGSFSFPERDERGVHLIARQQALALLRQRNVGIGAANCESRRGERKRQNHRAGEVD